MPTVTLSQTIDRDIADVFRTVVDVTSFPDWNPTTASAERLTDGPIGEGTRYLMAIRGFGKQELELQDYEENRSVKLVPSSRLIKGGHLFRFSEEDGATRVDHELEMTPKGLFKLMTPFMGMMARRNLRQTAEALEAHLEA